MMTVGTLSKNFTKILPVVLEKINKNLKDMAVGHKNLDLIISQSLNVFSCVVFTMYSRVGQTFFTFFYVLCKRTLHSLCPFANSECWRVYELTGILWHKNG